MSSTEAADFVPPPNLALGITGLCCSSLVKQRSDIPVLSAVCISKQIRQSYVDPYSPLFPLEYSTEHSSGSVGLWANR